MKKFNLFLRRVIIFSVLLALGLQYTVSLAAPANNNGISVIRVFGSTRYDTAFKVTDGREEYFYAATTDQGQTTIYIKNHFLFYPATATIGRPYCLMNI